MNQNGNVDYSTNGTSWSPITLLSGHCIIIHLHQHQLLPLAQGDLLYYNGSKWTPTGFINLPIQFIAFQWSIWYDSNTNTFKFSAKQFDNDDTHIR